MRRFQIVLLILGLIVFAGALIFMNTADTGEILWEVGMSILLLDVVLILLWPSRKNTSA